MNDTYQYINQWLNLAKGDIESAKYLLGLAQKGSKKSGLSIN
jgi:hypothetical protein